METTFLIKYDSETRDYTVSIESQEGHIGGIIGPTRNTFEVDHKTKMPKCMIFCILH